MKLAYYLAQRIKNTKNKTFSALIIKVGIVSVSIAISVLIISFFVLNGFKNTIKEKLFSLTSHIQVSKFTANRSLEETSMTNNLFFFNSISKIDGVKSVSRVAFKSIIIKSEDEISGVVLKGVEANFDWSSFEPNILKGRPIQSRGNEISNEIVISEKLERELNVGLNNELLVYFIQNPPRARKLKVVGIYASNVEELDNIYVLGDLKLIQKINNWQLNECGHLEVFLNDFSRIEEVKQAMLALLPQEYQVLTVNEILPQFFDWFKLLDRNIVLVIVLIIVVASFNMISVLLIMIMERTPMIGMLKSIGTEDRTIMTVFLINGAKILLQGMLLGNAFGLGMSWLQGKFKVVKLDPNNYYMHYVPIEWNWPLVFFVNFAVFVIVLFIIMIPILIIKRVSPVEALKYKD
jgi:lipoprotein-releasing system permease protein